MTIPETGPTVVPAPILIPDLAVMIPTESTFVTSSYVNTPAIPKSPGMVTPPVAVPIETLVPVDGNIAVSYTHLTLPTTPYV